MRWYLEDASRWLESLGFPDPLITRSLRQTDFETLAWSDPRCARYLCVQLAVGDGTVNAEYRFGAGRLMLNWAHRHGGQAPPRHCPARLLYRGP